MNKKLLIITYFFPPCNLTASQRAYNWAKYLKEFGYDPIVITRAWDVPIKSLADVCISSKITKVEEIENDNYKVLYMPYIGSLRDRILSENPNEKKIIRKALSFKERFFQNFSINSLPYSNIYEKAVEQIECENIENVIITGNPFECFHFGYKLKNKYPHINWVADYRDDWTTTELFKVGTGLEKLLFKMSQRSEKKWVNSASFFTTVSKHYVNKISEFTGVKGYEIINGFGEELANVKAEEALNNRFEITYNGTLYDSQNIEPFLKVIKSLILEFRDHVEIHLNFPGLSFVKDQEERVIRELEGVEEFVTITQRISRGEVLEIQKRSQVLLMIAHTGLKGIPSSKLYEYIGLRKLILLFPNDHDVIEETLLDTELGIICDSESEIKKQLTIVIKEFIKNSKLELRGNIQNIQKYSRKNEVKKLAGLFDSINN